MIAVGPGAPNKDGTVVPTSVKAGDRVLLPGWGGNQIKVGDDVSSYVSFQVSRSFSDPIGVTPVQEFYLFRDNEILAKIQE